jgi:hypothetical protein
MEMISICLATRERPDAFRKMCISALEYCHNPFEFEFIIRRDDDDPTEYQYYGNYKVIKGRRNQHFSHMLNECCQNGKGPIYMYITDDSAFRTKNWDELVIKEFAKYPDGIVSICPDGNDWKRWKIGTMGFLHQNWIDAVGWFSPPSIGQGSDTWINEIAVAIGRMVKLDTVRVDHLHAKDQLHADKKRHGLKHEWTKKYSRDENKALREIDIKILKEYIANYGTTKHNNTVKDREIPK